MSEIGNALPPTMLDITSLHVTESERVFSCPHVVVTLQPETTAATVPARPAERLWVLVKGYHDSGTIDDVFGPYTEEYANWLLRNLLDSSTCNWTMVKLSSGPEET